jgi:hypothetical protein
MTSVPKINNNNLYNNCIIKPLHKFSDTKLVKWVAKAHIENNVKTIGAIGITSLVLKDLVGGYFYVTQSLKNDKIPEDKRKFVAALDLTNTGLMIGLQLLMFATISQKGFQNAMFKKMFGKYFARPASKVYQEILAATNKDCPKDGHIFHNDFDKVEKSTQKALETITSLVAATIIGKRILVPFIATPLADKAKILMDKHLSPSENTADKDQQAAFTANLKNAGPTNLLERIKNKK